MHSHIYAIILDMKFQTRIAVVVIGISLCGQPSLAFASLDQNLHYGDRGAAVIALQEFLVAQHILPPNLVTGNFLSLTFTAVKAFQAAQKLFPVTGFFGPLTRARANVLSMSSPGCGPASTLDGMRHKIFVASNTNDTNRCKHVIGCPLDAFYAAPSRGTAPLRVIFDVPRDDRYRLDYGDSEYGPGVDILDIVPELPKNISHVYANAGTYTPILYLVRLRPGAGPCSELCLPLPLDLIPLRSITITVTR